MLARVRRLLPGGSRGWVGWGTGWCLLVGCVTPAGVARTRAANDFDCSEDEVTVNGIGGTSFRAQGCGHSALYDCAGSQLSTGQYGGGTSNYVCIPETSTEPGPVQARSADTERKQPGSVAPAEPVTEADDTGGGDGSECRLAYAHIDDLASAWRQWFPDRAAKELPARMDFLSVCHSLSSEQQLCLTMPYARTHRATCAPLFDMLAPACRARLDALFFASGHDSAAVEASSAADSPSSDAGPDADASNEAYVVLRITVGPTGVAENVTVLRDPGGFGQAAIQFASTHKYQPALDAGGRPVRGTITVRMRFAR
jgi:TonB family protein